MAGALSSLFCIHVKYDWYALLRVVIVTHSF